MKKKLLHEVQICKSVLKFSSFLKKIYENCQMLPTEYHFFLKKINNMPKRHLNDAQIIKEQVENCSSDMTNNVQSYYS